MKHQIRIEEIEFPVIIDKEICGSYGDGSHKSLLARIIIKQDGSSTVSYVVKENRIDVKDSNLIAVAISFYNRLP